MNWYLDVLKNKYAKFDGRARREEFWMFVLFNILIAIALAVVDFVISLVIRHRVSVFGTLYSLAMIIPGIAVSIRRLHDTNRSGWFLLLKFVCCIGWIILLIFYIQEGTPGENQYGPNPKEVA